MRTPITAFVTGATGFIGTKLVNELVRRGAKVRALARSSSDVSGLHGAAIEKVDGDILDRKALRSGMEGCQQVFHLAARAKNWAKDKQEFFGPNVEGTRNVLEAAKAAGVERIVCTSTIVTLGPTAPQVVGDENMPRTTMNCFTEYEESKVVSEAEVMEAARQGLPAVIVNPTRVFGPGKLTEGNSVTLLIDDYRRGRLPILLNHGINVGNYAFVDDLVEGYLLAMEKGVIGQRYILGGENASLRQFFSLVDQATGQRHRQFNFPRWAAMTFARFEKCKAQWFGVYPRITPGWVETFLHDWAFSCGKAERELGYRITPLAEAIRKTCQWLDTQRNKSK
jgi:farnesol dehydrogenase